MGKLDDDALYIEKITTTVAPTTVAPTTAAPVTDVPIEKGAIDLTLKTSPGDTFKSPEFKIDFKLKLHKVSSSWGNIFTFGNTDQGYQPSLNVVNVGENQTRFALFQSPCDNKESKNVKSFFKTVDFSLREWHDIQLKTKEYFGNDGGIARQDIMFSIDGNLIGTLEVSVNDICNEPYRTTNVKFGKHFGFPAAIGQIKHFKLDDDALYIEKIVPTTPAPVTGVPIEKGAIDLTLKSSPGDTFKSPEFKIDFKLKLHKVSSSWGNIFTFGNTDQGYQPSLNVVNVGENQTRFALFQSPCDNKESKNVKSFFKTVDFSLREWHDIQLKTKEYFGNDGGIARQDIMFSI